MIALCLESDDRLFHYRLYDWFLKRDLKEQLFRVSITIRASSLLSCSSLACSAPSCCFLDLS